MTIPLKVRAALAPLSPAFAEDAALSAGRERRSAMQALRIGGAAYYSGREARRRFQRALKKAARQAKGAQP
jgi:hypothetical protein